MQIDICPNTRLLYVDAILINVLIHMPKPTLSTLY